MAVVNRKPERQRSHRLWRYMARDTGSPNACRVLFNSSEFMFVD